MSKKKFDVDKFIDDLEADSDLPLEDMDSRYAECPRCGSDTWDKLIYSKKTGKPNACNECEADHAQ